MVVKKLFCYLQEGQEVYIYRIENCYGEYVELLNYGATVHSIMVRDKEGNLGDVVLGAAPEELENFICAGSTIGRCANRIAHGRYEIDGKIQQLEQNIYGHFIHGASGNYAHRLFDGEIPEGENSVVFRLHDSGEGGFDCCVEAVFKFSFDDEGRLTLDLRMEGEDTTVLNPTNHAYFNLSENRDSRDHLLWIASGRRVSRDEIRFPDGGSIDVAGTSADFTKERSIREAMRYDPTGYFIGKTPIYDEFYLLDGKKYRHVATLRYPKNGRIMKVFTDMPCLVLYVTEKRKAERGKNGQIYKGYCSVCLETGFVPNAVNCPQYDSPIFRKGEKLVSKTVYQFMTE